MSNILALSPGQVSEVLADMFTCDIKHYRPVFLTGIPGIGKTAVPTQTCERIGVPLWTCRPIQHETVEYTGLPVREDGKAMWLPFADLLPSAPDWTGVIFVDEVTQLDNSSQKIVASLLDKEGVAGRRIPPAARFLLAGNRQQDRAGASRMLSIVERRCMQIEIVFSLDDWEKWALKADIHPIVRSFGDFDGSNFVSFDPARSVNPLPGTWHAVSDMLMARRNASTNKDDSAMVACVAGWVGAGPASKFMAFREHYSILESVVDQVFNSPDRVTVDPSELSVMHAIIGCIAEKIRMSNGKLTDRQLGNVVTLANRFPDPLSCLLLVNIHGSSPQTAGRLMSTTEGVAWLQKHATSIASARRLK